MDKRSFPFLLALEGRRIPDGQVEHPRKEDFKSDLLRIPRAHGAEFDEKCVSH